MKKIEVLLAYIEEYSIVITRLVNIYSIVNTSSDILDSEHFYLFHSDVFLLKTSQTKSFEKMNVLLSAIFKFCTTNQLLKKITLCFAKTSKAFLQQWVFPNTNRVSGVCL